MDKKLSQTEAAAFLGISGPLLVRLKYRDKIPHDVTADGSVWFKQSDLEAYRAFRKANPRPSGRPRRVPADHLEVVGAPHE